MPWTRQTKRRAARDLDDLSSGDRVAVEGAIERLLDDPGSVDLTKLAGRGNQWRMRVGRWRVILELDTAAGTITVLRVLPRNEGTYR